MLYEEIVDEELAIMDEEPEEPSKTRSQPDIQAPLRSLMRVPVTIEMGASVQEAVNLMIENRVGAILVVSDGVLKGIFGERDVLLKILNKPVGDMSEIPVEKFMKVDPHTARVEDSLGAAILHMAQGGFRHIPVVNELNQPIGMVSTRHVVSNIIDHYPQEVLTLPREPVRKAMQAREGA